MKNAMTYRFSLVMLCLFAHSLVRGATLQLPLSDGKIECVGKFLIAFPSEVEIAMTPSESFKKGLFPYANQGYTFNNENPDLLATWGSSQKFLGIVSGPAMNASEFIEFRTQVKNGFLEQKRNFEAEGREQVSNTFMPIDTPLSDAFAWSGRFSDYTYLFRDGRFFLVERTKNDAPEKVSLIASRIRSRQLYEIPKEPGVCLHYAFFPDTPALSPKSFSIGVTYRLKDHPEVEIFFKEETASTPSPARAKWEDADYIKNFWEFRHADPEDKQIRVINPHIPGIVHFPSVTLGGYKGKASYIEITHGDGSLDYGYMANVKGAPEAEEDSPTLMLYVIRTAKRAKPGVAPIDRDSLKMMADQIAASITRRNAN